MRSEGAGSEGEGEGEPGVADKLIFYRSVCVNIIQKISYITDIKYFYSWWYYIWRIDPIAIILREY